MNISKYRKNPLWRQRTNCFSMGFFFGGGRICRGLTHGEFVGLFVGLSGFVSIFEEERCCFGGGGYGEGGRLGRGKYLQEALSQILQYTGT